MFFSSLSVNQTFLVFSLFEQKFNFENFCFFQSLIIITNILCEKIRIRLLKSFNFFLLFLENFLAWSGLVESGFINSNWLQQIQFALSLVWKNVYWLERIGHLFSRNCSQMNLKIRDFFFQEFITRKLLHLTITRT